MRRGWLIAGAALIVLATVYLAGRLPERTVRVRAEQQVLELEARLARADASLRASRILGELLLVQDTVARRNFGQAQQLASSMFDHVSEEVAREHAAEVKGALAGIQSRRDTVIAALARTDPSVADTLESLETGLRSGLGYGVP